VGLETAARKLTAKKTQCRKKRVEGGVPQKKKAKHSKEKRAAPVNEYRIKTKSAWGSGKREGPTEKN